MVSIKQDIFFPAEDTSPIHAGNFEVVQQLHHLLSVGVIGITVPHLQHRDTAGRQTSQWVKKVQVRLIQPHCSFWVKKTHLQIWAAWSHPGPFLCNVLHFSQPSWPQSASPCTTTTATTSSSYKTHRNHMSEVHKHGCVLTHNTKTHWRFVQSFIWSSHEIFANRCINLWFEKEKKKETEAKNKLTGCPRPATQWRSVPSPPYGSHDTSHWRGLQSSHGDIHLPR